VKKLERKNNRENINMKREDAIAKILIGRESYGI